MNTQFVLQININSIQGIVIMCIEAIMQIWICGHEVDKELHIKVVLLHTAFWHNHDRKAIH